MKFFVFPFLLVSLLVGAHFFLRKEYKVHPRGAILVTGASSGIGKDAAVRLASAGYFVFAGVRKPSDAEKILNSNVKNIAPLILDVTDHDTCVAAIRAVSKHCEENGLPFVALINNAGVSRRSVAEFHEIADIRAVYDTNVFGLIDITQLALPMLRQHQGRIIMISSIAGFFGE